MRAAAALALTGVLLQGCAALPTVIAMGAIGAIPGGATSDRAAAALAPTAGETTESLAAPAAQSWLEPAGEAAAALSALATLPPQDLAPGACALFLFSRGAAPRFVAYADADGDALTLGLADRTLNLRAGSTLSGAPSHFIQAYRGEGVEARLNAAWGDSLPQGRRAPEASLRLALEDGSAWIIPLSGLLACEPEDSPG